jgi:alpha-glucosidase (family GH31 glycosyl hydrolase)
MGRYSHIWLGDNFSNFESLRASIPGIFSFGMFGFSLVGADICGFLLNSNDTLCARWHTLGAFYPFSRNHNHRGSLFQDPYIFGLNSRTFQSAKYALSIRYSLLRYYYTELFNISLHGGQLWKPVFMEFPEDSQAHYLQVDSNIMIGKSVKFNPVLREIEDSFEAYFPNCNWNELLTGHQVLSYDAYSENGRFVDISGEFININLYIRGGRIVPFQHLTCYLLNKSYSSFDMRNLPISLIINLNQSYEADGDIILDDGISLDTIKSRHYQHIDIQMRRGKIFFRSLNYFQEYLHTDCKLSSIKIYSPGYLRDDTGCKVILLSERLLYCKIKHSEDADVLVIQFDNMIRMDQIRLIDIEYDQQLDSNKKRRSIKAQKREKHYKKFFKECSLS